MKKKSLLFLGGTSLLIGATFYLLLRKAPLKEMIAAILRANIPYLLLGLFIMLLYVALEGVCIKETMKRMGENPSLMRCIGYAFVGFYFSGITPSASGGQPAQIYFMAKDRCSISHSMVALLLISSVYQISMLAYGVAMYAIEYHFLMQSVLRIKWLLLLSAAMNTFFVLLILLALFFPIQLQKYAHIALNYLNKIKVCKKIPAWKEKVDKLFFEYREGARYIRSNPGLIGKLAAITVLRLTLLYLVPFFVYLSLGLKGHTALQMVAMQAILTVAVSALPLPGSVGVSESVFLMLFGMLFTPAFLLPGMVLTRGISFYAMLLLSGGIFSVSSGLKLYKQKEWAA
ncbi:lysylphosphatidylglycerol synthase transmembrane domain-containing protein [Sinanaerobacter sp. ZZT-01]|uniref:lysylphosphatidylglycerol synthase transmembrane domain-containing protein n=1 Tax=Sinanaerobacter sp. ZZT-01 TaxID=3111540 RepID=UPI002D77A260|nr:lysylphosphatidylglycerol synthase transmembrane domain-containing protein [Sinanaerobacter sp. ZZT-01]WRR94995.1 lysylphosphatidylglycerol synthase transmembrane domain-containing protein [Sinanaerobacter sp. ZZT-01]